MTRIRPPRLSRLLTALSAALLAAAAPAAYVQVTVPASALPTNHPYQQTLRAFLATLASNDYAVATQSFTATTPTDDDARYQLWLLSLNPPVVAEALLPAQAFTLAALEGTNSLALPADPNACQSLAQLAAWPWPGNPYRGSRALQLRALTLAIVDLVMLDTLHEQNPQGSDRADYLGGNLIWLGDTYRLCKAALPPEARAAYETGLIKLARRLVAWGPKGLMTDMDLFAPVGLWYVQQATGDPEMAVLARTYSRPLFTSPAFFNPAGYFVDNGCFDTSYNGISLFFGAWAALATDWPFARDALVKALTLRAHLCFPNPDTGFSGPSAMSSRTSGDPPRDQWQFTDRMQGGAMISPDAVYLATLPDDQALAAAPAKLADTLNRTPPPKLKTRAWCESHWSYRSRFAAVHATPGHLARLRALHAESSPLTLPLYRRDGSFIRAFGEDFVIARFPAYAAAIHTGPVGRSFGHNNLPYGYGGGQLATFWTSASGVTLAGRRRGVQGAVYESWSEWRSWPIHAVSGCTPSGLILTSARIRQPLLERTLDARRAVVTVRGAIPLLAPDTQTETDSGYAYSRTFTADAGGVTVETAVAPGTNAVPVSELYETLPLFLQELPAQTTAVLRVQQAGAWAVATPGDSFPAAEGIRVDRFGGAMEIRLDHPRSVHLSPDWTDGYQTRAHLCTARIALPEPAKKSESRVIRYTIRSATPTQEAPP